MKSWELSRGIIAYFQSYPRIDLQPFSFYSTVVAKHPDLFSQHQSSFDNPELKDDPMEILEEIVELLTTMNSSEIAIELMTNVNYEHSVRHQIIFEEYISPMIQILGKYTSIAELRESSIDILTLQGLYDSRNRKMISDVVNTVIYV